MADSGPVPRAPDRMGSEDNPREFYLRVRRAIDALAAIVNSLVLSGELEQVPGSAGGWTINLGNVEMGSLFFAQRSWYGVYGG